MTRRPDPSYLDLYDALLLDLDGRFIRRLHQHYKKVNQVCIDETGQVRAFLSETSDDLVVDVASHSSLMNTHCSLSRRARTMARWLCIRCFQCLMKVMKLSATT